MLSESFVIQNPTGLHARPVRHFVDAANTFPCKVWIQKGERKVNGKSVLAILTLGAKQNDSITLQTEGDQASEALAALGKIVSQTFAE